MSKLSHTFTLHVTPLGKPRMTQRDKWKKRPCVLRYRAFADAAREQTKDIDLSGVIKLSWVAFLPIPKSWSKKKKTEMAGQLHCQRPDRDNIDKAILDSLFKEDSGIAGGHIEKRWDDGNGPRMLVSIERRKP